MKPRTQSELDALYAQYPGLEASMELSRYCDYWNNLGKGNRAFGTGLGPQAHAEAQEAKRLHDEGSNRERESNWKNARGGHK